MDTLNGYIYTVFVLVTIPQGVFGMLECSQCVSDQYGDCATDPPPATPCDTYVEQNRPLNCMVAEKKNLSGSVVQLIRGCTGIWISSKCIDQNDNTQLCYRICSTDNCNKATQHYGTYVPHVLVPCLLLTMLSYGWNYFMLRLLI